jgi:hypothetical protein
MSSFELTPIGLFTPAELAAIQSFGPASSLLLTSLGMNVSTGDQQALVVRLGVASLKARCLIQQAATEFLFSPTAQLLGAAMASSVGLSVTSQDSEDSERVSFAAVVDAGDRTVVFEPIDTDLLSMSTSSLSPSETVCALIETLTAARPVHESAIGPLVGLNQIVLVRADGSSSIIRDGVGSHVSANDLPALLSELSHRTTLSSGA